MPGAAIEVGLGVWSMQSPYMRPVPHEQLYREATRHAQLAEALGYDTFWLGEHRLSYDGPCPSLIPAAAMLAAATSSIRIATGILILPMHSAARVAQQASAYNALAPGRLRLGLGIGYRPVEFHALGMEVSDRVPRFEAHARALAAEPGMKGTELWYGGDVEAGIVRAARLGHSLLLSQTATVERLVAFRSRWEAELVPVLDQVPTVGIMREVWIEERPDRAEAYRRALGEMWLNYSNHWVDDPISDFRERRRIAETRTEMALVGSSSSIVDRLGELVEHGADALELKVQFQGMEPGAVEEQVTLLTETVVPHLRALR